MRMAEVNEAITGLINLVFDLIEALIESFASMVWARWWWDGEDE